MNKKYLIWILPAAFMFACNNQASHQHGETEHVHAKEATEISLNSGEKWLVNAEMKPFVLESETAVQRYEAGEFEYHQLAAMLEENNNSLISSCTMEGVSHEELHKWLHPHLEMTKELKEAKSQEEADAAVEQLRVSFETYHEYFQ